MELNDNIELLVGKGSLKKMIPDHQYEMLEVLSSPCCGAGKKVVRIKDSLGYNVAIKSYPVTLDSIVYISQSHLEDTLAAAYGNGHVVILMNPKKLLVISNISNKDADGLPIGVPDFLVKT
jgi:hypothetical protein